MIQFYETYAEINEKLSPLLREMMPEADQVFRIHSELEPISGKEAKTDLEDYKFIERRILQQYLSQYNATYVYV